MASDQPYNTPRIFEVQDPGTNQHVVMVLMPTHLTTKFPSKPWGTSIADVGLLKKDSDLYPDYVLVDFEPMQGASDLFWIFQKLSGPEWATTAKERQNLIPQKFRSFVDVVTTEQEVDPATEPTDLSGDLVSSSVKQLPNTGKAVLSETTETINENNTALISPSVEDQDYITTETLVNEGAAPDTGVGVISSQVVALGDGKAIKTTRVAVTTFTSGAAGITVGTTFTGDATTNRLTTATDHALSVGDRVQLIAGSGALPTGLAAATDYYVQSVPTTTTVVLSATRGGAVIDITANGGTNHLLKSMTSTWTAGYATMMDTMVGDQNAIPAKFRNLASLKVWKYKVDASAAPTTPALGTGAGDYVGFTLIERVVKQIRSDGSDDIWDVVVVGIAGHTSSLVSYTIGEGAERVTVTETLLAAAPGTLPVNTATDKYELTALGNGMYLQVLRSQAIFPGTSNSHEQPINVPREFLTITAQATTASVEESTSTTPEDLGTNGVGVVSSSVKRVDAFTIQRQKTTLTGTKASSLTEKLTDGNGLVVTRTKSHGNATEEVPNAQQTVQTKALGDGLYESIVDSVSSVFPSTVRSQSQTVNVPREFLTITSEVTDDGVETGTSTTPEALGTNGIGVVSSSVQRVDAFKIKKSKTTRSGTKANTVTEKLTGGDKLVISRTKTHGAAVTTVPSATVSVQTKALGDGLYESVVDTVPSVFPATTSAQEQPVNVPREFLTITAEVTTSEIVAGTAATPEALGTNGIGVVSSSAQRADAFTIKKQKTTRTGTKASSLTEKLTDGNKQVVTRTRTHGAASTAAPSATVSVQTKALGDGLYESVVDSVPAVFPGNTVSREQPINIPREFLTITAEETVSSIETGTAATPDSLGTDAVGVVSVSVQQVDAFTIKKQKTTRTGTKASSVVEMLTDGNKQVVTRTKTHGIASTTAPSATVSVQTKALGDGLYESVVDSVPAVFPGNTVSREQPVNIPREFLTITAEETVSSIISGTTATPDALGTNSIGVVSSSAQRVDAFTIKKQKTTRAGSKATSITEKVTDGDKLLVTRTKTHGAAVTTVPSATVSVQTKALGDGLFESVVDTAPSVFPASTYAHEQSTTVPREFLTITGEITEQSTIAGTAATPDALGADGVGVVSASAQRADAFKVRKSKTTRSGTKASSLTEKFTDGDKVIVTRTKTHGAITAEIPSATKTVKSEAVGDGKFVNVVDVAASVFPGTKVSSEQAVQIPREFLTITAQSTESSIVEGTVATPETLGTNGVGIVSSSAQLVDAFRVQKQKTTFTGTKASSVVEMLTDGNKQVVTRTKTHGAASTDIPSATKTVQTKALGDGLYENVVDTTAAVFPSTASSAQQTVNVPARFVATEISSSSVVAGTAATPDTLGTGGTGVVSASAQRVDAFTVKKDNTVRTLTGTALTGKQAYAERDMATTTDTLVADGTAADSGLTVVSSTVQSIGGGKSVKQTTTVPAWTEHKDVEWSRDLQAHITKTEKFVAPSEANTPALYASYKPVNKDRSLKITDVPPTSALNTYVLSYPKKISIDLPKVLESVAIVWNESSDAGQNFNSFSNTQDGLDYVLNGSNADSAKSSVGLHPDVQMTFKEYTANNLFCTAYVFYLAMPVTEASLLSKLTTLAGATVLKWPVFKTRSNMITLMGQTGAVVVKTDATSGVTVSGGIQTGLRRQEGYGDDISKNLSNQSVMIPPCIHGIIPFTGTAKREVSITARATSPIAATYGVPITIAHTRTITVKASVSPSSLTETSPASIPESGLYLMDATVQPYEYGYAKVFAEVFNAASLD